MSIDSTLRETPLPYRIWGGQHIDDNTRAQMDAAMRLPVSVAGALMPDGHVGYGLPIGGVLATENAVIPYAVGVDIACRMRLSIFPDSPSQIDGKVEQFKKALREQALFGAGGAWKGKQQADHEVLDDPTWQSTRQLSSLYDKAIEQLGTSGTGNHFVNWGTFTLDEDSTDLDLKAGAYLALLSHSGSRGVGYSIANHYSRIASDLHPELDKSIRHLAWLDMDSEPGHEYWEAMELSGRFASANHQIIHQRVAKAVGLKPSVVVENHHNFAWKERVQTADGERDLIVHRKGATPAGKGVLGMIPGTMGDIGYIVRGRGEPSSINSAAHGAGRAMSRRNAIKSITKTQRDRYLAERNVILIGGGMDEAPQAYKSIEQVIAAQQDLVDVVGKFTPRIVRMANEPGET